MAVLVLGGAGYIGSHTAYELIDSGADVVIADNLETGHREAVHPQARFYQGDIRDRAFLDSLFQRESIDCVIHFAANSLVGESMTKPLKYYDNNLCGTKVLLESMVAHGIDKIVFSASVEIPQAHIPQAVGLRYFNACGAHKSGQIGEAHNPETHLIPLILQVPLGKRQSVGIFGTDYETRDGTCVRDYIHVTDLAQAHILAMEYLQNGGESSIFNLGNGVGFTVKEVIDTAREVTGHPIPAVESPRRAGDPAQLVASSEKARTVLGWKPQYNDLETIIASAWKWHETHPNGYGK